MKKSLSQAIALATLLGAAASAQAAVKVSENGLGGALLYPLYTVEQGNSTLVSVTNTTDEFKAIKIRFLEGMNSAEVLDFHLYLSPKDVWNGSIVATENGAKLVANDTSCVAGVTDELKAGLEFRNFEILADSVGTDKKVVKTAITGLERTRVGHFEVIEMGVIDKDARVTSDGKYIMDGGKLYAGSDLTLSKPITGEAADKYEKDKGVLLRTAIKHVNGTPGNCAVITKMWENGGVWQESITNKADKQSSASFGFNTTNPVVGGLYGTAAVVNVAGGWAASYDAVALTGGLVAAPVAGIYGAVQHPRPGSVYPSLATTGTSTDTVGLVNGDMLPAIRTELTTTSIYNDYFINPDLGAETDLVVSYPTKRFYVNGATTTDGDDVVKTLDGYADKAGNPFSSPWNITKNSSCDTIAVTYYNQEEGKNSVKPADVGLISPLPPAQVDDEFDLCYETNILSIGNDSNVLGGELVRKVYPLQAGFTEGWLDVTLPGAEDGKGKDLLKPEDYVGLPVIGFSTILTKNGNAGGAGVLANFAQTFKHKNAK